MRTSAVIAAAAVAGAYALPQPRQAANASATLISDLKSHNLTQLANLLSANTDVADKIVANAGPKLFLAPTDSAVTALPTWVSGNATELKATLLQHVLNGSFPVDQIPNAPTHSLGYSILTDGAFAAQPGGNGLPVSLSKRGDGPFDVFEGLSADRVTEDPFTIGSNITVAPIAQAITVPGTTSYTLGFVAHQTQLVNTLANSTYFNVNDLDNLPGVTVFVPTTEAWTAAAQQINATGNATLVALQHIVQNRAAFTPLLRTQGSLVNAAGQDVYYEASNNSVRVGSSWAKIIQSDIISKNGVIHTLDNVLLDSHYNESRSIEAALSARKSFHSPVTGFITGDNAGSTQGPSVPGPDANNPASDFKNSTVAGNDNGASTTGTGGPAGTGSDTSGSSNGDGNGNGNGNGDGNGSGKGNSNSNGNGNGGNGGNPNAAGSMYAKSVGFLAVAAVSAAALL